MEHSFRRSKLRLIAISAVIVLVGSRMWPRDLVANAMRLRYGQSEAEVRQILGRPHYDSVFTVATAYGSTDTWSLHFYGSGQRLRMLIDDVVGSLSSSRRQFNPTFTVELRFLNDQLMLIRINGKNVPTAQDSLTR